MPDDPALWLPEGFARSAPGEAAVFYIHPTTYLSNDRWNAPLAPGSDTELRTRLFVRSQASAFNGAGQIWAPRYRQAAFGAFLLDSGDAKSALDFAYRDVAAAFAEFLKESGDRPIILAGHSQGALHLMRLLREKVVGKPIAKRIVAAYVVGWPVDTSSDLPALGIPACRTSKETGCILSWMSFAEPANPAHPGTMEEEQGPDRRRPSPPRNPVRQSNHRGSGWLCPAVGQPGHPGAHRGFQSASSCPVRSAPIATRPAEDRRRDPVARPLRAAGQQLSRLRLRPVLGRGPARCGTKARGMAALITSLCSEFAAALPSGGKLLGLDVGTRTIGIAICDAGWHFAGPSETIRRTKFTQDLASMRGSSSMNMISGSSSASRSTWTEPTARAPSRSVRLRATSRPQPSHPAVGRALVDAGGRAGDDRSRREPRQARRKGRRTGSRTHPSGRDRRAGQSLRRRVSDRARGPSFHQFAKRCADREILDRADHHSKRTARRQVPSKACAGVSSSTSFTRTPPGPRCRSRPRRTGSAPRRVASVEQSSVSKGETLEDTATTLDAMRPDALVIRHRENGAPAIVAEIVDAR